jgi:hypothetical protein
MRVGDKDGMEVIYDEKGDLILMEGEEVIVLEENIVPQLKTTWRKFGGEDEIESVNGKVYLTNLRMVFVATPEAVERIGGAGSSGGPKSYAMDMDTGSTLKGFEKKKEARDYIELLIKEVLGCEIKADMVSDGEQVIAYVMASGKQYRLLFLAREDSQLLRRFKKKTVESSEELVANLKKYFENTDWVHG